MKVSVPAKNPKGNRASVATPRKPKAKPVEPKPTENLARLPDVTIRDDLLCLDDDGGRIPPDSTE